MNYSSLLNETSAVMDTAIITDLVINGSCSGFKIIDETETKLSYDPKTMTFQITTPASTIDPTKLTTGQSNQLVLSDGTTNKWTALTGDMKITSNGTTTIQPQTIDNTKIKNPSFTINNQLITLGSTNTITSDAINQGLTNKYYSSTQAQSDAITALRTITSDAINPGLTNKYYSSVQAQSDAITAIRTITSDAINQGLTNKYYSSAQAQSDSLTAIRTMTTDNIAQGTTNKYYSSAQAKLDAQFVMPLGPANTSSIYISNGTSNTWTTMKGAIGMDATGTTTLQPFNQIICSSIKGAFVYTPASMTINPLTPLTPVGPIITNFSPLYIDAGTDTSTVYINKNTNLGLLDVTGKTFLRGNVGIIGMLEISALLSLGVMPTLLGKPLIPAIPKVQIYKNPTPLVADTCTITSAVTWTWLGVRDGGIQLSIKPSSITSLIRLTACFTVKTNATASTSFSFSGFVPVAATVAFPINPTILTGNTMGGLAIVGPNQTTSVNISNMHAPGSIALQNYKLAAISSVASTTAIIIGSATNKIYFTAEEILQ